LLRYALGLSVPQKQPVEFDSGMESGALEYQVRSALVPYFLKAMRIIHDNLKRDAMVQQIVLLNRDALLPYLTF